MKRTFFVLLLAGMLCVHTLPVQAENDHTITYETGDPYAITYSFGDDYFIWNDPPDYCQWDANRWMDDKWGGSWQTAPLGDSGSLIGDVSCTIFSTCNALSVLAGIYIDPGQEAVAAYEYGIMSSQGVDYTACLYLADKYAVYAQKIPYSQVAQALADGKPVVAFTHGSVFSGSDHAISLFGYKDGKTFVRDPSHPERWAEDNVGGKWYDLDYIEQYNPNHAYVAFGYGIDRSQVQAAAAQWASEEAEEEPKKQEQQTQSVTRSSSSTSKPYLIQRSQVRLADFQNIRVCHQVQTRI